MYEGVGLGRAQVGRRVYISVRVDRLRRSDQLFFLRLSAGDCQRYDPIYLSGFFVQFPSTAVRKKVFT